MHSQSLDILPSWYDFYEVFQITHDKYYYNTGACWSDDCKLENIDVKNLTCMTLHNLLYGYAHQISLSIIISQMWILMLWILPNVTLWFFSTKSESILLQIH